MILNKIEIKTTNLNEISDFYQNALELPVERIDKNSILVTIGQSTLKIIEDSEKSEPIYHLAFNIPENKLQEATHWSTNRIELIKKEDEVLISDFETWNANSVYFFDTDGNLLEFIARHDLNNAETSEFSSKQILNISEIGIVQTRPDLYGEELIEKFNLHLFEKNQNSDLFTAIGDDNGLLIIVKKNRNWFPTETPAKSNWTNITLTESGTETTIKIRE
jgi:catechol-2,3-dioxygenase